MGYELGNALNIYPSERKLTMSGQNTWWVTKRDNDDLLVETSTSRVYRWVELVEGPYSLTEAENRCRKLNDQHHEYLVRTHDPTQQGIRFLAYSEADFPKLRRMGTTIIEH